MPKIIELTVEIDIQKVSCPGVWLCQGGCVCLTVFALGTSYQTCFLPPIFPLMFKDVFYFKKRYQEACALNNICCLLKDETIYCELVQCSSKCVTDNCVILAQYLGAMNDVLFPPNMCANEGVDLLMRRSKIFPGILSPKIEIATKVRIDELWNQPSTDLPLHECLCKPKLIEEGIRQKQVCHSARYHRAKCDRQMRPTSRSRSPCRSRSAASSSCNRNKRHCLGDNPSCVPKQIYNSSTVLDSTEPRNSKITLRSTYIECDPNCDSPPKEIVRYYCGSQRKPCICEICTRYHELFHCD